VNLKERLLRFPARRVAAVAAGLFLLWAVVGFLAVPRLVLSKLPPVLSTKLHRPVTLKNARFNPFTLALTLEGLTVGEKEGSGTFVSVERAFVNAQLSSVLYRGAVLSEVVVQAPSISVARTGEGTYSVSDLIEEFSKDEPGAKPARFSVANIRVVGGSIRFDDRPAGTKHEITELTIGIPFLSNLPVDHEIFTQPFLGAKVNGSAFGLKGKTKPFSGTHETTLDIDLADVDLPFYLAYVPMQGDARLVSGRLDTNLTVSFRQETGKEPAVVVSGKAELRQLLFADADKAPLAGAKRLVAILDSADPFRRSVSLRSLTVEAPEAWILREKGGGYPIAEKFLGNPSRKAPAKVVKPAADSKQDGSAWNVEVAMVAVTNGKLHYRDEHPHRPFEGVVEEITVTVTGLSTAKGKAATLEATATRAGGERYEHSGKFTLDPESSEGTLKATGVVLKSYSAYYEDLVRFDLEGGTLDVSTKYRWPVAGGTTALSDLSVSLKDVRARKTGEKEDFLRIPSASMTGAAVDPEKNAIQAGALAASGVALKVVREKDGGFDLTGLVGPSAAGDPAPPAPTPAGLNPPGKGTSGDLGPGWTVRVASLDFQKGSIRYTDLSAPRPVALALSPVSLTAQGLSTARGEKGKVGGRVVIGGKGSISVSGTASLSPLGVEMKSDVKDLDLTSFTGYFPERVQLSLIRGTVSAKGTISVKETADGSLSLGYSGDATCAKLRTVDPFTAQDFLTWNSLYFGGMKATWNPLSFTAEKVAATDLFARLELYEDGTPNVQRLFGLDEPPPVDDAAAEAAMAPASAGKNPDSAQPALTIGPAAAPEVPFVRIDAVTLQGGTIHIDDHFVKPSYRAEMKEVGGRISGLSSVEGTRAEVDLRGRLESSAPLEISGTVNPFSAMSFADIRASFRDIDLVPMTPYFVKYAGYAVQKGRLTMNVDYKLDERKLKAQNSFVVDQFTFGEKVESPTATKLPVKLGVSLLKDPDGVIRLDVPISGSVDDPKFRVGPIVWKVIGNLLLKAVSSPFALLSGAFGGGKELSFVDFAPGTSSLDPEATKRLEALASALAKRPALKLEVEGKAEATRDAEGMRRLLFERKVKARKAEELAKGGTPAASVDDVAVSKGEWPEYLKRAYKKESFPKPRTALGIVKEIPADEMEKLMLANIVVSPDDLRQLALSRAEAVKEFLLGPGKAPPDRVFLVDPAPAAEPKPGESLTRAAFVLR
jgi:hypothetical protein